MNILRSPMWIVAALAILAVITLGPVGLRPETLLPHQVEREIGFGTFGVVLRVTMRPRWLHPVLIIFIAAATLELLQLVIPGRDARLLDFFVMAAAGCIGIGAVFFAERAIRMFRQRQ